MLNWNELLLEAILLVFSISEVYFSKDETVYETLKMIDSKVDLSTWIRKSILL